MFAPAPASRMEIQDMGSWLGFVVVLAAWMVLQRWVLPKLGVPT